MKLFNIVVLLLFCAHGSLMHAINIKLLKGTHDILQGADQYYAPFWGLPFVEEGVAEDLYDLSGKQVAKVVEIAMSSGNKSSEPNSAKIKVLKHLNDKKNTATQNLVESLFHKTGGTFNVSVLKESPAFLLKAKDIGVLLQKIKLRSFYYDTMSLMTKAKVSDQMFHHMLRDFDVQEVEVKSWNSFKANPKGFVDTIFDQYLKKHVLKDPGVSKSWNQLVSSIKLSLLECDSANQNALYPPNTTQGIILGYMLQKVETKQDLQDYFEGFLGTSVTVPADEYGDQDMLQMMSKPVNFASISEFADCLCCMIYQKNYESDLPKIAINKKVLYEGIEFTDCVENAIRNISNIVMYDFKEKSFINNIPLGKLLGKFYSVASHRDPSDVANLEVHQAWMELLQNVPGVKYAQLKLANGADCVESAVDEFDDEVFEGFIPMVHIDTSLPVKVITIGSQKFTCYKKEIGDKKYLLIPQNLGLHCFEVHALLSNVVKLLDYLFEFHVLQDESDVFVTNFNTKYFSTICSKLGLKLGVETAALKEILIDIPLYKGDSKFILQLKSIHADVFIPSSKKALPIVEENLYGKYPVPVAAYLSMFGVDVSQLVKLVGGDIKSLRRLMSFVDVRIDDAKLFMIDDIVKHGLTELSDFVEGMLLTLSNLSDKKAAVDSLLSRLEADVTFEAQGFVESYLVMLHVMKIQSSSSKTIPLCIFFLQLLGYQSEQNVRNFVADVGIVLQGNYDDDIRIGLRLAALALQRKLISKTQGGLDLLKLLLFGLDHDSEDIFNQVVMTLWMVVRSEIVSQIEMVQFMLGFAKHSVTALRQPQVAINIVSLLIDNKIVRDSDLIMSFDSVKANKNKVAQEQGLLKIINMFLDKMSTRIAASREPVRSKVVVEEVE